MARRSAERERLLPAGGGDAGGGAAVPADESYRKKLPDSLQAQLYVALETYKRKRSKAPAEHLLWAGAPHLRTRSLLLLFALCLQSLQFIILFCDPVFYCINVPLELLLLIHQIPNIGIQGYHCLQSFSVK